MQWYLYGGKTTILNDGLLIDSTDHKMTTWILLKVKLNREGTGDTCSLIMHYFLLYNKIYVSGFSTRKSIQKTPIQSQIHENKYDCMPNTKQLSFPTTCQAVVIFMLVDEPGFEMKTSHLWGCQTCVCYFILE